MSVLLRLAASIVGLTLGACAGGVGPGPAPPAGEPPAPPSAVAPGEPPTLLLAAHMQPPGPGDRDYVLPVRGVVYLLFSRPIDPLSVSPQHFVLVLGGGGRVIPVGAFLQAGAEPGESRSVALLLIDSAQPHPPPTVPSPAPPPHEPPKPAAEAGKPPAVSSSDPISVTITGLLHDADGRLLEGLALDVAPPSRPVFAVRAEVAPALTCGGFEQAVRVFWSAPVRRLETSPWPLVGRSDGTRGPAAAVDDDDDPADDAVLDLCLRGPAAVTGVVLPAGAAVDLRGAPTAAGTLAISPAP